VRRDERQAYLGLAWQAAPTGDTEIYAVDLLSYILGDGPASRLNQSVREQKRLVTAIESVFVARQLSGLVSVTARLEPGNLQAAEAAVLEVIRRVREQGVTDVERQRVLITAESTYAFDIETMVKSAVNSAAFSPHRRAAGHLKHLCERVTAFLGLVVVRPSVVARHDVICAAEDQSAVNRSQSLRSAGRIDLKVVMGVPPSGVVGQLLEGDAAAASHQPQHRIWLHKLRLQHAPHHRRPACAVAEVHECASS
jgi:peptidase M16-like protein